MTQMLEFHHVISTQQSSVGKLSQMETSSTGGIQRVSYHGATMTFQFDGLELPSVPQPMNGVS